MKLFTLQLKHFSRTGVALLIGLVVLLGACSNKQIYRNIQDNRVAACDKEPNDSARSECLRGLNTDYSTYQRQREALIRKRP